MFGLTDLGVIHTAISLAAVAAGVICFFRYGAISPRNTPGKTYIILTVLTCLTGFGIFQHGGFGKPHVLGVVTLLVLAIAGFAGRKQAANNMAARIETICYTATFFFHMIPALAEGTTRLPPGAPLFANPEAPEIQFVTGIFLVIFLFGASYQVWKLRGR